MQQVIGGAIALFILARSNLSTSRRVKVEINNPYDQLTAGRVENGIPIQPTYGKMKVWFNAPNAKRCKTIGTSNNGQVRFHVFQIDATPARVNITVPAGNPGAGQVFNRANWIRQNSGEGYYVIRQRLKTWNGSTYPSSYPGSYRDLGLKNYYYETAQRYQVYDNEADAIASAENILSAFNNESDDTGDSPSLPPPVSPEPERPPAPPLDPNPSPELPPYPQPSPQPSPNPSPQPLPPMNDGGMSGGMGDITFTENRSSNYDNLDFVSISTFQLDEGIVGEKKFRFDESSSSGRRGEEPREESRSEESYYEEYRSGEDAREGGFQEWMSNTYPEQDISEFENP